MQNSPEQRDEFSTGTFSRQFVISPYLPNGEGVFLPQLPTCCPLFTPSSANSCKIGINHYRDRKTGPCFKLLVAECHEHGIAFTLYPHGHVPYGRTRIAPVAPDNSLLAEHKGIQKFSGSIFDAAIDAAKRCAWDHRRFDGGGIGNLDLRFSTQVRHLDIIAQLLGIHPDIDIYLREEIAQILSIPGQLLHDSASLFMNQRDYQSHGRAICHILEDISVTASVFERLAQAGSRVNLWPQPYFWDGQRGILRPALFRSTGTRASPG